MHFVSWILKSKFTDHASPMLGSTNDHQSNFSAGPGHGSSILAADASGEAMP
jgi:hypothetical protein